MPTETPAETDAPSENPFKDINETDWFYEEVIKAHKNGLISGVSETEFSPYMGTTRGMFITILYRIEGEPKTDYKYAFKDVPENEYYAKAVAQGDENKIIWGYSAEEYSPDKTITREQMAAIYPITHLTLLNG